MVNRTALWASLALAMLGAAVILGLDLQEAFDIGLGSFFGLLGGSFFDGGSFGGVLGTIGKITPNAWALEAYTSIFWRDESASALLLPVGLLVVSAILGLLIAQRLTRRLVAL